MLLTSHAIVGTAIGAAVGNPVAGFVLGVASHVVLDATPHFDPGSYMKPGQETYDTRAYIWAVTDVLAALAATAYLTLHQVNPVAVVAGGIGAMLPDIVLNPPFWKDFTRSLPGLRWFDETLHHGWHWTVPPADWLAGVITQIVAVGGALWLFGF